jgi:hypothetical protein
MAFSTATEGSSGSIDELWVAVLCLYGRREKLRGQLNDLQIKIKQQLELVNKYKILMIYVSLWKLNNFPWAD